MSSFYLIVKRGETSLRLGYSAQQVHIIIIIICPCSAQWSMFLMERRFGNKLIIIIIITDTVPASSNVHPIMTCESWTRTQVCRSRGGRLTTGPTRRSLEEGTALSSVQASTWMKVRGRVAVPPPVYIIWTP